MIADPLVFEARAAGLVVVLNAAFASFVQGLSGFEGTLCSG